MNVERPPVLAEGRYLTVKEQQHDEEMMIPRDGGVSKVPRKMFVTKTDRAVLDLILQVGGGSECIISNRQLTEHLGLPYNRQASRHWSRLVEMGLIEVVPRSDEFSGFQPNKIIPRPGAVEARVGDVYEFQEEAAV